MEAISNDTNFRVTATVRSVLSAFENLVKDMDSPYGESHALELSFMLKNLSENELNWSNDVDAGKLYTDVMLSGHRDTVLAYLRSDKSPNGKTSVRTLYAKVLLLLGIRRKNVEDLMLVCDLIIEEKVNSQSDFRDEIKLLR